MKKHFNIELSANVGSICEETPDNNPCAGSQIYLTLLFKAKKVTVTEKYVTSCDKVSLTLIGEYHWKLLPNKEISIDFDLQQTKDTYAENLVLELRDHKMIGKVTRQQYAVTEYIFKENE